MAKGFLVERTRSIKPAEKPKPAIHFMLEAMIKDIAVNKACIRYNTGATNMNENSIGSVTPVKKLAKPAANIIERILFLFSGLAFLMKAKQAPKRPNIIIGKKPA